jgi:hypothetical protein
MSRRTVGSIKGPKSGVYYVKPITRSTIWSVLNKWRSINISTEGLFSATFLEKKKELVLWAGELVQHSFNCSKNASKENKPASVYNSGSQVLPCGSTLFILNSSSHGISNHVQYYWNVVCVRARACIMLFVVFRHAFLYLGTFSLPYIIVHTKN